MRSAKAPAISAGVITANIIWKAQKARCGTEPLASKATPRRPTKSKPPMRPPWVAPKESE